MTEVGLKLRKSSGKPLGQQIRKHFLSLIESGALRDGDRLPAERELAAQFGVSMAPVRTAMQSLDASGHVERIQGLGTFVRSRRVSVRVSTFPSFTSALRKAGVAHEITFTHKSLIEPPAHVAQRFGNGVPRHVVWMRRIAWIEGRRVALLESWMDASRFGRVLDSDFAPEASLSKVLRSMSDRSLRDMGGVLSVTTVDDDMAEGLDMSVGAPVVQIWRCMQDEAWGIVDVSRVLLDPSVFSFVVR